MYNYQAPPGPYGRPPSFGGYPGQSGAPGMGAPPGMAPPGMPLPGVSPAPGMQHVQSGQPGFPPSFQAPPNMPNINFSAPVIRLGTTGPSRPEAQTGAAGGRRESNMDGAGNRRGAGLGFDGRGENQQRHQMRDNMMSLQPPTREEIARTIFVGNITEGCGGDDGMQRILSVAGGLRRWIRATDADNKPCTFGFAEYEDADSLGTACEVFQDVEVPTKRPLAAAGRQDDGTVAKTKLLVVVDENSQKYIEEWRSRGSLKDPAEAQFRLDTAREELEGVLASLSRVVVSESDTGLKDIDGDMQMQDGEVNNDAVNGEVVTIPITVEDELSDIPAEMRETVAREIASFRDRSTRRDLERLRREEEMEQEERRRNAGTRVNRLGSPPANPAGVPAASANAIPVGPRDRGIQGAPIGPKGFQGAQIPQDYRKGVNFVNGNGNGVKEDEEDTDASDEELETRRKQKREAELEKTYLDQERHWLNRERARTAAVERQRQRDKDEAASAEATKNAVATRLKEWNDEEEATRKAEEYYMDRSQWLRNRAIFRAREAQEDDRDRALEEGERAQEQERRNRDLGMADQFLAEQAEEMQARAQPREPARFKMSLGAAAQRVQAAAAPRRTIAEVEGLLEDEEDEVAATTRRTLIPIQFDSTADGAGLSEEERASAARRLANDIPTNTEGLWKWDVKWEFVDEAVITEQLRPFVEKKIVEYLGVQEQMLVDVVEECVRKRGKPQDLVKELEGPLEEEAEVLVKKLWRMLIFFSESEKRGLAA